MYVHTLVVARGMSAPAWTSRSTTSVWPFWLATYTGLTPFCVGQQQKIVRVWYTISADSMCLKFKAEHAEDNTHSESLLQEKISWYWLWSVQPRIHTTRCIHFCCTGLLLHTTVLYIVVLGMKGCQGLSPHNSPTASPYPSYSEQHPSILEPPHNKDRLPGCCDRQPPRYLD